MRKHSYDQSHDVSHDASHDASQLPRDSHLVRTQPAYPSWMAPKRRRFRWGSCGCGTILLFALVAALVLTVFLFAPLRTNILIMGLDYTDWWTATGRTDTLILVSYNPSPFTPYVRMLSIPRDLWVSIPGFGENRINTAHFFAELQQAGTGPRATIETVRQTFGVDVDHYIRIRFEGFREVIDAMGGVDIELTQPMAGYPPGSYHLTGNKALAFARHRMGSDDFFRMENGQFLMKSILRQMVHPAQWLHLPGMLVALTRAIETDLPVWQWPRLAVTILRLGPDGIENRTITREMVTPYVTSEGADVLLPNWELINPLVFALFGQ